MAELARVRLWATALITEHLPGTDWDFEFDRAKRRAGLCNFTAKRITVSRYLAEKFSDDEIHQVLLHEIAHAVAGPTAGHGTKWAQIAGDLGYTGGRTHQGEIAHESAPWVGSCPGGHQHVRFRKPTKVSSCGRCARGFSPAHRIRWQKRNASE